MYRFLIADDHAIVRRGLKQILIEGFPNAEVTEVGDTEEMIKKVMQESWDVIISDLSMPGRSGLEALLQVRQIFPKLPVLILSVHPENQYALRVLKAGASGYLTKESAPEELINAVQKVLLGKKYITPEVAEKLASSIDSNNDKSPHENLSNREFDVLKLIAVGKSISDIADALSLSSTTVSTYRTRIMEKMALKTNADLTLYAINHGLL